MQLLKSFNGDIHEQQSVERTFKNVQFSDTFFAFAEALALDKLFDADFKRTKIDEGTLWNDSVRKGGLRIVTEFHPSMNKGSAGDLFVRGSPTQVQKFEALLGRYASYE